MRWIVDTSAWSRRGRPEVRRQLEELIADAESEFVLSPAVELELLREPQGATVAAMRRELEEAMDVLAADAETFRLATGAMLTLAGHGAHAHRVPVPDLITAALAHQHECGVAHIDSDFELLAAHAGLRFPVARIAFDDARGQHPAHRQRALKNELAQLCHQMPVADAEAFLEDAVRRAHARLEAVGAASSSPP